MSTQNDGVSNSEGKFLSCFVWLFGGSLLGLMTLCASALLILVLFSFILNVYMGWRLSGFELVISRQPETLEQVVATPTVLIAGVTTTPTVSGVTATATPGPILSPLEQQVATLSAIATRNAGSSAPVPEVASSPTPNPESSSLTSPPSSTEDAPPPISTKVNGLPPNQQSEPTPTGMLVAEAVPTSSPTTTPIVMANRSGTGEVERSDSAATSGSTTSPYRLIPLETKGNEDTAAQNADLNLELREPQALQTTLTLIEGQADGDDEEEILLQLADLFEPEFIAAYALHTWNADCDCKGDLIQDPPVTLLGLKTVPDQPVYIPKREQTIYEEQYHAVVLYASENSVTIAYDRNDTVLGGPIVYYLGLQTHPDLLNTYRQRTEGELPGLTMDTPVGTTTDELRIAIRNKKGLFTDPRLKKYW